ncbi:MAG: TIGR00159 family protein, partial [Candidatus Riflebacteria bacterium]
MQTVLDLFLAVIRDISFIDVLDMILVSYGIYRALLFIEGTRAYNLLKGLGIILLLLVITKDLDFNTVSWFLANALPTGFLALVVIF